MADEKDDQNLEPELPPISGSEIEATINVGLTADDGISRPVFINQFEQEVIALTLQDAERLYGFLGPAIKFLKEHRDRILQ